MSGLKAPEVVRTPARSAPGSGGGPAALRPASAGVWTPTVCVIAADPVVRSGIAAQLRDYAHLKVVSGDGVDVVVLAADVVDTATAATLTTLRSRSPVGIVVVAGRIDPAAAGCLGLQAPCEWVPRSAATPFALGRAVMAASRCRHLVTDHAKRAPAGVAAQRGAGDQAAAPGDTRPPAKLSSRQIDVLRRIADGHSTAVIAEDLSYSESTIKNIVRQAVELLGARNRTHAVATAIRLGLLPS